MSESKSKRAKKEKREREREFSHFFIHSCFAFSLSAISSLPLVSSPKLSCFQLIPGALAVTAVVAITTQTIMMFCRPESCNGGENESQQVASATDRFMVRDDVFACLKFSVIQVACSSTRFISLYIVTQQLIMELVRLEK